MGSIFDFNGIENCEQAIRPCLKNQDNCIISTKS